MVDWVRGQKKLLTLVQGRCHRDGGLESEAHWQDQGASEPFKWGLIQANRSQPVQLLLPAAAVTVAPAGQCSDILDSCASFLYVYLSAEFTSSQV